MLVALLIVVPLTAAFLAWFYLFRNNTDIPVSPGAKPFVGHMHHFMDITMETLYLYVIFVPLLFFASLDGWILVLVMYSRYCLLTCHIDIETFTIFHELIPIFVGLAMHLR